MAKKKKSVKRVKRVNVNLPQELVEDILLRLPVKTLLCCRCVCKSWLSLIFDNNFATSHFQLASTHRRVFINRSARKSLPVDGDAWLQDDSAYASSNLDFISYQSYVGIMGSCRGFLFLHGDIDFYLWNPSTGAHKQIPASPITHDNDGYELLSGFAYDQSTDDYLIVSLFCKCDGAIKLMIFSLRANKWKPMEVASHLPDITTAVWDCVPKSGLSLNGSIHWIVYNEETFKNVIIAFDIKEIAMLEIPLPDDFISICSNFSIHYDLIEVGGLIGAWMHDLNTVKIYVMQEYGVHSSWTKIIQFSADPVLHKDLYIACLTKCGDIVGRNYKDRLVKFNDKGKKLETLRSNKYQWVVYTESLFSLPSSGRT
ncbi:F-box/kelch-repeat protein At3g06240-like [Vicia villosa]|uniref:F-box/kelch-repeat protein At3g06240-like n=1 Tax=Vicia villosa TaxID=3911 RepID=UPI00273BBCAE|nr:F-box/kelch-repeat protein At3g06240-like [Vicia villosa]